MSASHESQRLQEQLDEITRREAWLRVRTAQRFLALEAEVKELRRKTQALSDELGARNTYIHELHLEREARRRDAQALWADLEAFTAMLATAEEERDALRAAVERSRAAARRKWGRSAPATAATPAPEAAADLPGYDFLYYLYTQPFRLYRAGRFTLRGWVMPRDGREITAIRVRVAGGEFFATRGIEEPEVIREHGAQAKNPRPGFEVEFTVAPGRHRLRLEAQLEHGAWHSILSTPIWAQRD